jgi:hypothetical protein
MNSKTTMISILAIVTCLVLIFFMRPSSTLLGKECSTDEDCPYNQHCNLGMRECMPNENNKGNFRSDDMGQLGGFGGKGEPATKWLPVLSWENDNNESFWGFDW